MDGRRGGFPAITIDKVAPHRRTASDEAVVSVRKREHGQEGNCLTANTAEPPPNSDPVVVLVMSLFAPTAMTYDRIARTNGAPAIDSFCGRLRPIDLRLALSRGKCDKDNRGNGGSARGDLGEIATRAEPSSPSKNLRLEKNIESPPSPLIRRVMGKALAG